MSPKTNDEQVVNNYSIYADVYPIMKVSGSIYEYLSLYCIHSTYQLYLEESLHLKETPQSISILLGHLRLVEYSQHN